MFRYLHFGHPKKKENHLTQPHALLGWTQWWRLVRQSNLLLQGRLPGWGTSQPNCSNNNNKHINPSMTWFQRKLRNKSLLLVFHLDYLPLNDLKGVNDVWTLNRTHLENPRTPGTTSTHFLGSKKTQTRIPHNLSLVVTIAVKRSH